jgi:CRISPR-associated endonuclease/helicase Cas3
MMGAGKWSLLWSKTGRDKETKQPDGTWHPLALHMIDVAACADALLDRVPERARKLVETPLNGRSWTLIVAACHDLGKACPAFQTRWRNRPDSGLSFPSIPGHAWHGVTGQLFLTDMLIDSGWEPEIARQVADASGAHHGLRADSVSLDQAERKDVVGGPDWAICRKKLFCTIHDAFPVSEIPKTSTLTGPEYEALSGFISIADWIGSNSTWFPYGTSEDCSDLSAWFHHRRLMADIALDLIGWVKPVLFQERSFSELFNFKPRPLQEAVASFAERVSEPGILLIEAPCGEGKTEACLHAAHIWRRKFGHGGLIVTLPSIATSNAMHYRMANFLSQAGSKTDLQLAHGKKAYNKFHRMLRTCGFENNQVTASEWFAQGHKRAFLSEHGVGTIDQALQAVLPTKHQPVRLWGMADKVIVFDEIHACDVYMSTVLLHLLRWLLGMGSSVMLLSATLPAKFRQELADLVGVPVLPDSLYPRLSFFSPGHAESVHFEADPERQRTVKVSKIGPHLSKIKATILSRISNGGYALGIVNTVGRAQRLWVSFGNGIPIQSNGSVVGKKLPDGTEVYLLHARFPAWDRSERESVALSLFGADVLNESREGKKVLIATQVAEQSLDLDFDVIASDLAPIDILIQRLGRLWRKNRTHRFLSEPELIVAGLFGNKPPEIKRWWGPVYHDELMIRTWLELRGKSSLSIPDDVDTLVQAVYGGHGVSVPSWLLGTLKEASYTRNHEKETHEMQAHRAIIGRPDDMSWDDPDRQADGNLRKLMAQTRLVTDSIQIIPVEATFNLNAPPDLDQIPKLMSKVIQFPDGLLGHKFETLGVPLGWQKVPGLRECYALVHDQRGIWVEDDRVRVEPALGCIIRR